MLKIIKPKAAGKTKELILMSSESKAYIVCRSLDEANQIQCRAIEMGLEIPLPITYNEILTRHGVGRASILIDNIEMFAQYAIMKFNAQLTIEAITMDLDSKTDIECPKND